MAQGLNQRNESDTVVAPDIALDTAQTEPELDPEIAARRDAALAHVRKFGDPVLKAKARPVERFDAALGEEIRWMAAIMGDGFGIGLAANQVGTLHRLLVYRVLGDAPLAALINPVIVWSSKESEFFEEGCLSLPLVHVDVERPVDVAVTAQDEYGSPITVEASGLEARVIQHEMDHLNGILILDRTTRDQRRDAMKVLREWQDRQRPA
ncbi:MAG: peptide deformylase [Solirubrobacteraceae bacterium]